MRHAALVMLAATGLMVAAGAARAEYFCSPGFEPSYGGTCVAVPARAEIELFVDQPLYVGENETVPLRRVYHRRHHRGLRARY